MKHAVVIIPTYNERENIVRAVTEVLAASSELDGWYLEVLVVDDNSPDRTYELVREMGASHSNVHLLLNESKAGLGAAYLAGMRRAFEEMGADVAFEFDADLSHDPHKIPEFLKAVDGGADLVLGSRYVPGGGIPPDWGPHRKVLSWGGNIFVRSVFPEHRIRDWTTGFRAIRRSTYEVVVESMERDSVHGYTFQIAFLYEALRRGLRVEEIPFHFVDRTHGESKLGTEYIRNTLLFVVQKRLRDLADRRFTKFATVGASGVLVQLVALHIYWSLLPYQLAFFLAVETAVVSNFTFNNLWTFSDKMIRHRELPHKFVQFNLASGASIALQQLVAVAGQYGIGLFPLFTVRGAGVEVNTGHLYAVIGIALGMFWNFFMYTRVVWGWRRPAASDENPPPGH